MPELNLLWLVCWLICMRPEREESNIFGEALKWFHKAAEQGHNKGSIYIWLGMYKNGEGVEQNLAEAFSRSVNHLLEYVV